MSDKSASEKMRLKPGMRAAFSRVPPDLESALGVPEGVIAATDPSGADFVLQFATTQAEADELLASLQPHVGTKTIAWIAYPKGSKGSGYDLNRDTVAGSARGVGLVVCAAVAIDQKWSALPVRPL